LIGASFRTGDREEKHIRAMKNRESNFRFLCFQMTGPAGSDSTLSTIGDRFSSLLITVFRWYKSDAAADTGIRVEGDEM